jgi:hypothetical protein
MGHFRFKAIYFPGRTPLSVGFSEEQLALFRWVNSLSSGEIRKHLRCERFDQLEAARGGVSRRRFIIERLSGAYAGIGADNFDTPQETAEAAGAIRSAIRRGALEEGTLPSPGWPRGTMPAARRAAVALERFAPDAKRVLDPFAGTGVYPVVAAQLGLESYYCEISPVYRFLIDARVRALLLGKDGRWELSRELKRIASGFLSSPGAGVLGPLGTVESLQRVAEQLTKEGTPLLSRLFSAAVVAALLRGGPIDATAVKRQLDAVADYIQSERSIRAVPTMLTSDAARLRSIAPLEIDTVITNPPGLNSFDYFPPAASEFLRLRRGREDDGGERLGHPASSLDPDPSARWGEGTRDEEAAGVYAGKLSALVDEVTAADRTRRAGAILEIKRYFASMTTAFAAVVSQLSPDATMIIDVADSRMAGVRVPTIELLADFLGLFGFGLEHRETLSERRTVAGDVQTHEIVVLSRRARDERGAQDGLSGRPIFFW